MTLPFHFIVTAVLAQTPCPTTPLSTGSITEGTLVARLRATPDDCPALNTFSLKRTEVDGEVSGFLASMNVVQVFSNPYSQPLEAIYVFPLPEMAAVDAMEIRIGARVITGVIQTREKARETYEKAKSEGKAAALLDQERPNIFTQTVANILPGEEIRVRIHYVERLKYEAGGYELNFPMTVGPRFIGGDSLAFRQGEGTSPDTTRVTDASRITPPVLPPDVRSGRDIRISLRIDAGLPIHGISSSSHHIDIKRDGEAATVTLNAEDTIPNKTFTVSYRTADALIRPAVLVHRSKGADEGFFMVMMQPQLSPSDAEIVPREIYMVLDTSCSQSGQPIEKSKAITREVLNHLHPDDTFQILNFDTRVTKFEPTAVPNTVDNVTRAQTYVKNFWGGGGTDVNIAVQEAMVPENDPTRLRMVLLMTDGFIGDEAQVLSTLKQARREQTRVFGVGVGNDVNRYLVRKMGEDGRGDYTFVNLRRPEEDVAQEFESKIRGPVLTSMNVDTGVLPVSDVYPKVLPDLFQGQPLFIIGKFQGTGRGTIRVTGQVRGEKRVFEIPVTFPEVEERHSSLRSLWARQRIDSLSGEIFRGNQPELVQQITDTALTYSLMSQYTSFVAVEQVVRVDPNSPTTTEMVPVLLPEGVSFTGATGELSRTDIPPGDPVISIKAPRTARRVTAYFPFGLMKSLTLDSGGDRWRGRFLVPTGVADGDYTVSVIAELADGTIHAEDVPYRLDAKGNDFDVKLSTNTAHPGQTLSVSVDAYEATKEVSVYCDALGKMQLQLESSDSIHFTRQLTIPQSAKPGVYQVVLVARDPAGNRFERRISLEITSPTRASQRAH